MTNCISERHVLRGRKRYRCWNCEDDIEIGQPRTVDTYVDGRDLYQIHNCMKCEEFTEAALLWTRKVGWGRGKSLSDALDFPDGRDYGWLRESFWNGIKIDGTFFHDREAATAYMLGQLSQPTGV